MMKIEKARIGEKLVLDDRGGVWEKTGVCNGLVQLRCYFGGKDMFGKQIEVDPHVYCYIIFDDSVKQENHEYKTPEERLSLLKKEECGEEFRDKCSGIQIKIVDELSDTLLETINNLTIDKITAISASDIIRFILPNCKNQSVFHVSTFAYDINENVLYIMVLPEREPDKEINE